MTSWRSWRGPPGTSRVARLQLATASLEGENNNNNSPQNGKYSLHICL